MNISSSPSYVKNVTAHLQQLSDMRQEQIQVTVEVAESMRQVRQRAVDQNMEASNKQAERLNEIKSAGLQARGGSGIDVWT